MLLEVYSPNGFSGSLNPKRFLILSADPCTLESLPCVCTCAYLWGWIRRSNTGAGVVTSRNYK